MSKTRELPALAEAERRLRAGVTRNHGVSVPHADYRFRNCLVDPSSGQ